MRKRQLVIALSSILGSGVLLMSSAQAQAVEDWHGQSGNGPFSVVFDGNVYTNRWWVEGSHCPKNASAVNWSNAWQLDRKASSQEITASGNPTDCSAASTGTTPASPGGSANTVEQQQLTGSHKKGDVITFNEKSYVAKRDTQGVFVPGEKSVWQKYSKPVLWEADTTYTAGDHVIYRGQVYLAQWWVKGKIPTENLGNGSNGKVWLPKPHFVFLDTSKVDGYDSGIIYRKGDAVRYQSTVYLVLKDIGVEGITPETSNPWKRYIDWTGVSDKVGESANPWPKHTFAPYVDASLMSVPDFKSYMKDTGTKHFILAFLVNAGGGGCYYAWGGVSDVKDGPAGLYHNIKSLRKAGGDVLISIGGANNSPLAAVCEDVDELKVQYRDILNNFNLKALDFDIEGGHVSDVAAIERRSSALRMLQDELRLEGENVPVWFTLPVLPNGLTHDGIKVIESAVEHGVELAGVNLMTMDYGGSMGCQSVVKVGDRQRSRLDPTRNINGECAISASESVHNQLKKIYSDNHQDVGDAALWRMIGITPMIGVNDQELEVFFPADAKAVRSHGVKKGVGILSMWSVGRDTPPPANQSWQVSPSHSGLPKQEAESRKFSRVLAKYDTLVDEAGTGSETDNAALSSTQEAASSSESKSVAAITEDAASKPDSVLNKDTTPDQFRFPPLNRTFDPDSYVSYAITVRGIDAKAPVSVKAGDYSINGGSYTKAQGWVNNGDKVSLRIKSSHEAGKSVSSILTIGGVSGVFSIITKAIINKPPVAQAGADQSVTEGTRVTLNGKGSSDSDGSIKRYVWKEGTKKLSTSKKFSKVFGVGMHTITLKVIDDKGAKSRDKVRITVKEKENKPPVAKAGADQNVTEGTKVTLNGSGSSDSDGNIKRYVWKEGDKKLSTNKKFSKVFGIGTHNITLEVTDDKGAKSRDKVKITVKKAASTVGMDRSPDAFELMSKADATGAYHVSHGSHVVSDTIIVGGINVPAPISVSGKMSDFRGIEKIDSSGEYRINYGSWKKTTGTVRNGDKVQVRHSQEKWIPMNRIITTLVIGDQRDDLISSIGTNNNERLTDIQPFSFGNETGRINTLVESPIIYPEGTKDGGVFVHVSMSSPNGEYRYNSGPGRKWSEWLSLQTSWLYMTSGIQMRLKSPSVYGESITAKINVSGREGTFTVTAGNRPKSFNFTDINDVPMSQIQTSNEVRISGITGSVEVSVEKGSYSVNGTAFTSKQGMVKNGDSIRVRHTSAGTLAAEMNTTLTIGGVSGTFISKTSYPESGESSPDDFHFESKVGVERGKHIISDKATITGLYEGEEAVAEVTNGSLGIYPKVTISMDPRKGSYAENLKWCQAQPGFVEYKYGCKYIEYRFVELPKPYVLKNGLNIYLRILSSDQPNTTASATLKVGIKSATFSVTTK